MTHQSPSQIALARLSFAASIIDTFITATVILAIYELLKLPDFVFWVPLLVVPALHLFLKEVVFGGQSIGKFCLGLKILPHGNSSALSYGQRFFRFSAKLPFFGLRSLSVNKLPFYNETKEVYLKSDLLKNTQILRSSPIKNWRLKVLSGLHRGQTFNLIQAKSFKKNGEIRIGRDPAWADFSLKDERQISSQHCILKAESDMLYIRDFGTNGSGSSNGTFLKGRRLSAKQWTPFNSTSDFQLANVKLMIIR